MIRFAILIAVLLPNICYSEVPLQLFQVRNRRLAYASLNDPDKAIAIVNRIYQPRMRMTFMPVQHHYYTDTAEVGLNIESGYTHTAFDYWYDKLKSSYTYKKRDTISLGILPPLYDDSYLYYGGSAYQSSANTDNAYAVVFCGDSASSCGLFASHELGHVIGMRHYTPIRHGRTIPNVMHPAPGSFGCASETILHRSRRQARRYLQSIDLWDEYQE